MPAKPSRNTIARNWDLLRALPSGASGKTPSELKRDLEASGYQVTLRQVQRDLEALEPTLPIRCEENRKGNRWSWVPGHQFELRALSTSDALSLSLLERTIKPLLPAAVAQQLAPVFAQADRKLQALSQDNAIARWRDKVAVEPPALPTLAPTVNGAILAEIQNALLADETVSVEYVSSSAKDASGAKKHVLYPLGLVQRGPVLYLVAATAKYPDSPATYALHRFVAAKRRHEPASKPAGFSLQRFIDDGGVQFGGTGRRIQFEAWVSDNLTRRLLDARIAEDQELRPGPKSGSILTATVPNTWQLEWWILSKANAIKVLGPKALHDKIEKMLKDAAALYP